jgi:hypothetical protein
MSASDDILIDGADALTREDGHIFCPEFAKPRPLAADTFVMAMVGR